MITIDDRTPFNLINLTAAGISIAEYPQIKSAFLERYKQIFGSDIDLSTGTADGIFLENQSLMVNNILQTMKMIYGDLDIRSATGVFLDTLCALSGIYRKAATYSIADLELTLESDNPSETVEITAINPLTFVDKAGTTWITNVPVGTTITLTVGNMQTVRVRCSEIGPIKAVQGWINQLIDTGITLTINQPQEANIGTYEETDSELRNRRNLSMSPSGITVMESLIGSLLQITGIEDCIIYNNNTASSITANDGTTVLAHQVYIAIRRNKNISISDNLIGSIIYEKMTPGIGTAEPVTNLSLGIKKNIQYQQYVLGVIYSNPALLQQVWWKECTPIDPEGTQVSFEIKTYNNFMSDGNNINSTTSTYHLILLALIDYFNNLKISQTITNVDIINIINDVDPMFRGQRTYSCIKASLNSGENQYITTTINDYITSYTPKDTYFDFTSLTISSITEDSGIITVNMGATI